MLQQIHRPTHLPTTSAHLAQTMALLHLGADELNAAIERELAGNPALEQVEAPRCPGCGRRLARPGLCAVCTAQKGEVAVFTAPPDMFFERSKTAGRKAFEEADEIEVPEALSLPAHLLQQIGPELAAADRPIAAHLLMGLDDEGLLANDPAEVAVYFHVPQLRVERVREMIQRAEPLGCGSRSPQEALQIQLKNLPEIQPVPALAEACLANFDLLTRRQFTALAEKLKADVSAVEEAVRFISANLNPYPARAFWGNASPPIPTYRTPDVVIRLSGSTLIVEIAQPFAGALRINPLFKRALHEASEDKIEAWLDDLQRAELLVKCIQQRAGALERLMGSLATRQREFILRGPAHLKPLTRAALATELGLHESTISRAVAGKSVQLPNGRIAPLAIFFETHLSIRTALRRLVESETKPLSDDELARQLGQQGFAAARRTVAKYRNLEGILPAYLRKH